MKRQLLIQELLQESKDQSKDLDIFKLNQKIVVLTAWHVLKGVREGEEVDVVLVDGRTGSIDFKSITRIGNVDMAIADVSSIEKS